MDEKEKIIGKEEIVVRCILNEEHIINGEIQSSVFGVNPKHQGVKAKKEISVIRWFKKFSNNKKWKIINTKFKNCNFGAKLNHIDIMQIENCLINKKLYVYGKKIQNDILTTEIKSLWKNLHGNIRELPTMEENREVRIKIQEELAEISELITK